MTARANETETDGTDDWGDADDPEVEWTDDDPELSPIESMVSDTLDDIGESYGPDDSDDENDDDEEPEE